MLNKALFTCPNPLKGDPHIGPVRSCLEDLLQIKDLHSQTSPKGGGEVRQSANKKICTKRSFAVLLVSAFSVHFVLASKTCSNLLKGGSAHGPLVGYPLWATSFLFTRSLLTPPEGGER